MKLIQRFYDPEAGELLYNNINLKDIDNKWYHQDQITIVQQEPALFSGTIRENIMYGCSFGHLSEAEIEERFQQACEQAQVFTFMNDKALFPEGEKTVVGERGVKMSGGQKQRIAIARALIRKPRVLLLDEATSALDAESEHQVQQALDKLMTSGDKMTVVVIAHRLSTIKNANNIVVLGKGNILEQGTHDDLVARKGAYHKLVERQLMSKQLGEDK
jgi:ABC-type multidrug transport system fused ATPase/permease subunit